MKNSFLCSTIAVQELLRRAIHVGSNKASDGGSCQWVGIIMPVRFPWVDDLVQDGERERGMGGVFPLQNPPPPQSGGGSPHHEDIILASLQ